MDLALKLAGLLVLIVGGSAGVLWLAFTDVTLAGPALAVLAVLAVAGIVFVARDAGSPPRPPE